MTLWFATGERHSLPDRQAFVRRRQARTSAEPSGVDARTGCRLLILSVSAGAGHVRAAEALQAWAEQEFGTIPCLHLDIMQLASHAFRRLYANLYISLVDRHPMLWGMLYRMTDTGRSDRWMHKLRRAIERSSTRAMFKRISDYRPTAIVCTHFLPAELLAHATDRGRLNVPVWVQVTDYDLHSMWVLPKMAGYFAGNNEVAFRMRQAGIADACIHKTGIPIMPAFSQAPDRAECAREIGIDPDRQTLLLMGGGAGVGNLERIAEDLLAMDADFQLIALAGRNTRTLSALQKLARLHPQRLFPRGYTNHIERLMACADLAISKPGGLTSSECLAMGVPMIVHSPIAGQEEKNADYLVEHGAALKATDTRGLVFRVGELIASPQRLARMREQARKLAHPHAALNVLNTMLAAPASQTHD